MPFQQGEASAVQPESAFPPAMQTLQGAIRTALAQGQGWVPKPPGVDNPLPKGLGDRSHLGDLRLTGPFLKWGESWLYPVPSLLVGGTDRVGAWQWTRLKPSFEKTVTDLGEVNLPQPEDSTVKGKNVEAWLTTRGLEAVLAGGMPQGEDIIEKEALWKPERRVGLTRDDKRTAKDKHLYMPIHTRPTQGLAVVVGVEGVPSHWHPEQVTLPLGGEGRLAAVEVKDEEREWLPDLPELRVEKGRLFYTATLLTPGSYDDMQRAVRKGPPDPAGYQGLPGRCLSASIGKPERIGGWDLQKNAPRALEALLPAGSTWWMAADEGDLEQVIRLHGCKTGRNREYGWGQLVIGTWNGEAIQG